MFIKSNNRFYFVLIVLISLFSACTQEQIDELNERFNTSNESLDKDIEKTLREIEKEFQENTTSNDVNEEINENKTEKFIINMYERVSFRGSSKEKFELFILSEAKEKKLLLNIIKDGVEERVVIEEGSSFSFSDLRLNALEFRKSSRLGSLFSSYTFSLHGPFSSFEIEERELEELENLGKYNESFNVTLASFSTVSFTFNDKNYNLSLQKITENKARLRVDNFRSIVLEIGENHTSNGLNLALEEIEDAYSLRNQGSARILISEGDELLLNESEGVEIKAEVIENLENFEVLIDELGENDFSFFDIEGEEYQLTLVLISENKVLFTLNSDVIDIDLGTSEIVEDLEIEVSPSSQNKDTKVSIDVKIMKEKEENIDEEIFYLNENEGVSFEDKEGKKHKLILKKVLALEDTLYLELDGENLTLIDGSKEEISFEHFKLYLEDFLYSFKTSIPSIMKFKLSADIRNFQEEGIEFENKREFNSIEEGVEIEDIGGASQILFKLNEEEHTLKIHRITETYMLASINGTEIYLKDGESDSINNVKIDSIKINWREDLDTTTSVSFTLKEKKEKSLANSGELETSQNGNSTFISIVGITEGAKTNFEVEDILYELEIFSISDNMVLLKLNDEIETVDKDETLNIEGVLITPSNFTISLDKDVFSSLNLLLEI